MEKIFYLAQILGTLNDLTAVLLGLALVAILLLAIWYFTDGLYNPGTYEQKDADMCKKWLKRSVVTAIIATLILIFVPSKKTYLFMVGGHALEEIAHNEQVQEKAGKTVSLLEQYLENKVAESAPESTE
jgi:hypothetical protein